MPYLPFDQRCIIIPNAGTNDPVGSQQAQQAIVELQQMVARAQAGADAFVNRTPGDFSSLGLNLMKDVQRSTGSGGTHGGAPGYGAGGYGAGAPGWGSRFVTGPGGHTYFWPSNPRWAPPGGGGSSAGRLGPSGPCSSPSGCGPNPCDSEDYIAADVAASDDMPGLASLGAPPLPAMTTTQGVEIPAVSPPPLAMVSGAPAALLRTGVAGYSRRGVGSWTPSVAQPGAVPANCGVGKSIPWWLWLLGALAVAAVVGDEKQSRRSSGQKRAA
jgi:hypothetical protein